MKWLIHLYPKKWRDRYGEEFLYILENRSLSFKEVIDVGVNALDARILNLVEGVFDMNNKVREIMLGSVLKRFLIIASIVLLGSAGGYWLGTNTSSISELPPLAVLLIGLGSGLFIGYVAGVVRGIMRVITVAQKEDVFLPNGKLEFNKSES